MNLFGLGQQKPHHYRDMARIAWENRDELPYAWRILRDGVCDFESYAAFLDSDSISSATRSVTSNSRVVTPVAITKVAHYQRESGASGEQMQAFARLLVERPNAIFVWSMGLTQHAHGVDTIKALVNVGPARGLPGRPSRGLVPIRGHSGVQGGAEVGCAPSVDPATAERWSEAWGFPVSPGRGWTAAEMVDHSSRGEVDLFWIVGGNFLETLPDAARSRRALARPRLRVHQDIVVSSSMLVEGEGDVVLLPAATRYESPGGGTETSTERRIIFSPEIPGRRIGSARPEWQVSAT